MCKVYLSVGRMARFMPLTKCVFRSEKSTRNGKESGLSDGKLRSYERNKHSGLFCVFSCFLTKMLLEKRIAESTKRQVHLIIHSSINSVLAADSIFFFAKDIETLRGLPM